MHRFEEVGRDDNVHRIQRDKGHVNNFERRAVVPSAAGEHTRVNFRSV
jgi:hypothetical protein